jgi:hypothetical protein
MSKLREELEGIYYNINRTEIRLAEITDEWLEFGGVCCPYCYSSEYRILVAKQLRRIERENQIKIKLNIK